MPPKSEPKHSPLKTQSIPTTLSGSPAIPSPMTAMTEMTNSPQSATHPFIDLETGNEVPEPKNRWWMRKRKEREHSTATSRAHAKTAYQLFKEILFSSVANVLLVFVPVGIALHFVHVSPTVVFIMNFLAIVPLAGVWFPLFFSG